jgi:hypothetical protein
VSSSQAALYGGDCSHSLISIVFAHACPDWWATNPGPVHYLFLDLVAATRYLAGGISNLKRCGVQVE